VTPETGLILSYIAFIWLVVLHTFEEISCDVMGTQVGPIRMTKAKYLFGASVISTLNLTTLALLITGQPAGIYLGLFASAIIGVFQAIVHGIGYLHAHRIPRGLGAGFYSSIPLALMGIFVFIQLVRAITA